MVPDRGLFLKIACLSGKKNTCRFALKTGSVIFLLFFTLAAPLAPLIAQIGSAAFIFLVMVLSPLMNNAQPAAGDLATLPEQPPMLQTAELNSAVREFVFYNEIPDAALRNNQRQQLDWQTDIYGIALNLPYLCDSGGGFIDDSFILNYPAEYLAGCQPPRAGPYLI